MSTMKYVSVLLLMSAPLLAADRPNVVFILADDLGINDLHCYGREEHQTPHLDALAKQGLRFTSAYAACPVCSPTRAALMTGLNPARLHLTTFLPGRGDAPSQKLLHPKIKQQLPLEQVTIAERFRDAGYATACIGKWHLGNQGFTPDQQGFQTVFSGKANTKPSDAEGGKGEYELTAKAIHFIDANATKPFFLYLAHHTPHIPLAAKPKLVDKYKNTYNPVYAAIIESMDDCVGQLITALNRNKLADKTIVIFTSDNGGVHIPELKEDPPTHNTPYRAGKGFVYEGGLRVPLIVRYPGTVPADKTMATPLITTDWSPTLLRMCNITTKDTFDGIDMSDIVMGSARVPKRNLYWHVPHYMNQGSRPAGAMRDGNLKYIEHYEDGRSELYDLEKDPGEQVDMAKRFPEGVAHYRKSFADWRREVNAQENTPNPAFNSKLHKAIYNDVDVSNVKVESTAAKTAVVLREWRKQMDAAVKLRKE
ncbi:sulfatase [soil metagenome]